MSIDHESYFQKYGIRLEPRQRFLVTWEGTIWDIGFAKWPRRRDVYRSEDYVFTDIYSYGDRFSRHSALGRVAELAYYTLEWEQKVYYHDLGPCWDYTAKCLADLFGEEAYLAALKISLDDWLDEECYDSELGEVADPIPVELAYRFFRGRPECEPLRISFDEYRFSGRTYYSAALHLELEEANEKCLELDLPYEFIQI